MLTPEEKKSIIDYRRQKAYDNLNEAKEVAKFHFWNLTGNRLYYATFHMASALLLDKGMSAKKSWRIDSFDRFSICNKRAFG